MPFLLLAACEPCTPQTTDPVDVGKDPVAERHAAPPQTFAVDEHRLIGWVEPGQPCPAPEAADWQLTPLFQDEVDEVLTQDFAQYCIYVPSSGATSRAPFAAIKGAVVQPIDLVVGGVKLRVSHDHTGLSPAGIAEDALRQWFLERFDEGAGVPRRDPAPDGQSPRLTSSVSQLVLLDTVPTSASPYPDSNALFENEPTHGLWLAGLAQLLTCVDRVECPVAIHTRQVMGRTSTSYSPGGGVVTRNYGTIAELARGIRQAVRDWKRGGGPRTGNLVLNLSLAWHPFYGGGLPGGFGVNADGQLVDLADGSQAKFSWDAVKPAEFAPDVRAVFQALAFARCEGALVFAAAGNTTAGPKGGSGPMMPAAWDAFPTASLPACTGDVVAPDANLPLVVAVGGVEPDGRPLATSRPDSQPLFVADGDHAWYTPELSRTTSAMPPITGTSVSTVVVSSAAAALWTVNPTFTPLQVLTALASRGQATGEIAGWAAATSAARFGQIVGQGPATSRMVRVCDALEGKGTVSWACKITDPPAPVTVMAPTDPVVASLTWPGAAGTDPACADRRLFVRATSAAPAEPDPCPSLQYYGPAISPWVNPQPDSAGCGLCVLNATIGRLYIKLSDLAKHSSLVVTVKTATAQFEFALPSSLIQPGQTELLLEFKPTSAPDGITSAVLSGVLDGRGVVYPVLVQQ